MSNKRKLDDLKSRARKFLRGELYPPTPAESRMAERISATNKRLALQRAMRRELRARRSITRRAEQSQRELLAKALLA